MFDVEKQTQGGFGAEQIAFGWLHSILRSL